jgi:hypothetical protein
MKLTMIPAEAAVANVLQEICNRTEETFSHVSTVSHTQPRDDRAFRLPSMAIHPAADDAPPRAARARRSTPHTTCHRFMV